MTWLLNTPREGGEYVSRCVPDADRLAPTIQGSYPSRGLIRTAWQGIWHALSGGLWFSVDELTRFEPSITVRLKRETVERLMRKAYAAGLLAQRPRAWGDVRCLEYSRQGAAWADPVSLADVGESELTTTGTALNDLGDQPDQTTCEDETDKQTCYVDPLLGTFHLGS